MADVESREQKKEVTAQVVRNTMLTEGIFELVLKTLLAEQARPGQFVNLYCRDGARLLPRPISICDAAGDSLRLVFRVVGSGTGEFSALQEGETVRMLGCLGNGYDLSACAGRKVLVVGGGLGVPPMLFLMRSLQKLLAQGGDASPAELTAVLGYRDLSTVFLEDSFREFGRVVLASDDGSVGIRGTVVDAIRAEDADPDVICACGPMPMLRALAAYAKEKSSDGKNIKCYVSLEERMACGIGACLGCVTKTTEVDEHSRVNNARICVEGPVFDAAAIAW